MQKIYVAAGALLLGTSALAWAADKEDATVGKSIAESAVKTMDADKPMAIEKYAGSTWSESQPDADLALASAAESMDKSALGAPVSAKLETGEDAVSSDAVIQSKLAMAETKTDPTADGTATATAMSDHADPAATAAAQAGMGGTIEGAGPTLTASLAPRPAAGNYPACEPGPGDDNCIQLYERGVRAELASWNAPTGGLAGGTTRTAMGGPYEPVAGHADASATGGLSGDAAVNDRIIDTSVAEPQGVPLGSAEHQAGQPDAAEPVIDADYQGVGGPVVSQSGYPPCEPGAGDDRCIQLYERGVTGAGN